MNYPCPPWFHALPAAFSLGLAVVLVVSLGKIPTAEAAASSGQITAVDAQTGLVTARETATGRTFQFKIDDARVISSLKPGQLVQADFQARLVSLPGVMSRYKIVTVSAAPGYSPGSAGAGAPAEKRAAVDRDPGLQVARGPQMSADQTVGAWFFQHGGAFHRATDPTRPAILLFHGLRRNSQSWTRPADDVNDYYYDHRHTPPKIEQKSDTPGIGIFKVGTSDRSSGPVNENNWFDFFKRHNFTVATWSQPGKTFDEAYSGQSRSGRVVDECNARPYEQCPSALQAYRQFLKATETLNLTAPPPIALMGHSRGGLLIRKLLKEQGTYGRVRWMITLHSPHDGSELAQSPETLRPEVMGACTAAGPMLVALCYASLEAWLNYYVGPEGAELGPGGPVVGPLAVGERALCGVAYYTFGGISPTLFRLYIWPFTLNSAVPQYKLHTEGIHSSLEQYFEWEAIASEVNAASPMLGALPHLFPEWTPGYGDSLVADARARLPSNFAAVATHFTNELNHAEVLWDRGVQERVVTLLSSSPQPCKPKGPQHVDPQPRLPAR